MTKVIICDAGYFDCEIAFEPFLEDAKIGYFGMMGNREYNSHIHGIVKDVINALDHFGCYDFNDIISDLGYTPKADRTKLYKLFERPCDRRCYYYYGECDKVADILSYITGDKWETVTIKGYCQGDFQDVIYNTRFVTNEYLKELEDVYFGNIVSLGIIEDDSLEVDTYNVEYWDYISYYHDDKKSICEKLGFDPDTVTLYKEEEVKTISYTYSEV